MRVGIDPQPFTILFSVKKTPLCLQNPAFTLTPIPGFLTFNPSSDTGTIVITNATQANHGIYTLTLSATLESVSSINVISLTIQDPCENAKIITTPDPIATMIAIVPAIGTISQTYSITTDKTLAYPNVVCNFMTDLTPTAAFISLTPNQTTITLLLANVILPTDLGVHSFMI